MKRHRKKYPPEAEQLIRDYYPLNGCTQALLDQLCQVWGLIVTGDAVMQKAHKMGLKYHGPKKGYEKGHVPENKGKKMSAETREKVARTWFKKGNLPHNTKSRVEDYVTVRMDHGRGPVVYLRVSVGNWVPLHRHVYLSYYKEIPDGMVVKFKDGDPFNCRIENLTLVSRAENLAINAVNLNRGQISTELTDKFIYGRLKAASKGQLLPSLEQLIKAGIIELERSKMLLQRYLKTFKIKD